MKTTDILLIGGALVAGSYFIGKGISNLRIPDFNLNPSLNVNADIPDLPKLPDFGNIGETLSNLIPTVNETATLYYWNIPDWVETPQYITYPGGLRVPNPKWMADVAEWYKNNKPLVEVPGLPSITW